MAIHEPESTRLGRDIDKLVEFMEHEKRESDYLDQQISILQEELSLIKAAKKTIFPSAAAEDQQRNKCSLLEKRIELEVIHLNETKAHSQALRNEVNNYRKDKSHYKRTLQNVKEDITKFLKATEDQKKEFTHGLELENRYKKQIQNLRSKSMLDRSQYSEKVSDYSVFIKEKIEIRKQIHKQIEEGILGQIKRQTDSVEITKLQKTLLDKWVDKIKDKKKALDAYMKHLNVLQETFNQIKLATGIHSVTEIVTSVIKSEEQNYEVYSYVNSLNTEVDHLNETYRQVLQDIQVLETQPKTSSTEDMDLIREITQKKEEKKQEYERLSGRVQELLPVLKEILGRCMDSPVPIPRVEINLDEIDTIEYEDMEEFLGNIENYFAYAHVFLRTFEGKGEERRREKTPMNLKDLEIRDTVMDQEFEDSRVPLSVMEFQQRSMTLLRDSKFN